MGLSGIFFFLLFQSLFCTILTNAPLAGEHLDILVEGGGNASVLLIAPDKSRQTFYLQNGQLSILVEQPGRYQVQVGKEHVNVDVVAPNLRGEFASASDSSSFSPLLILFCAALLVMLALAAAGAWALAFPFAPPRAPVLVKKYSNGQVELMLTAGSVPLQDVRLEGAARPDGNGLPPHLSAPRLAAGQSLHLRYATDQPSGEARASFKLDGVAHELRTRDGPASLQGATANLSENNLLPPPRAPAPRRKLRRI